MDHYQRYLDDIEGSRAAETRSTHCKPALRGDKTGTNSLASSAASIQRANARAQTEPAKGPVLLPSGSKTVAIPVSILGASRQAQDAWAEPMSKLASRSRSSEILASLPRGWIILGSASLGWLVLGAIVGLALVALMVLPQ